MGRERDGTRGRDSYSHTVVAEVEATFSFTTSLVWPQGQLQERVIR